MSKLGANWVLLVGGIGLAIAGGSFYFSGSQGTGATVTPVPAAAVSQVAVELPPIDPTLPVVKVWKSPTCGCCGAWVDHMRQAGFQVEVEDVADVTPYKAEHGVGAHLQSCHTSLVDGYAIEGHVPADDIKRLLAERAQVAGLAAPGMPIGSPGMEAGNQRERYDVLAFQRDGSTTVWATHP